MNLIKITSPGKRALTLGVAAALSLTLVACSSSGSGGGSGSSGGSSGGSTAAATGSAATQAAAAKAKLTAVLNPPTKISLTTPLPKAPSAGLMVWMNCDVPACTVIGNGVKAGVEAGGWKYTTENYQSADPATLTAALLRALKLHPTAVSLSGIPPTAGWSSVFPAYEKAGVPIIPTFLGDTTLNKTLIALVGGPPARITTAETMADWFISDSGGKGHALLQRVDGYPVLKVWADTFEKTVKAGCSACKVTDLSNTIADAGSGNIVPSIIPKLRGDSSINYLFGDLEFYDALPAAMSAAGLTGKVKVAGQTPDVTGLSYLKKGTFSAATPAPNNIAGWFVADAAFRYQQHLPVPAADQGPLPYQLYLPTTSFAMDAGYENPANYPAQFKALWKTS